MCRRRRLAGLTLLEVVIFIVVLAVGFAGMLILYNQVTRASVDPLVRKQALAIAQSLLEEIELRPYTYCDPDDANVYTATSATVGAGACAATVENIGQEGETRYGNPRFDNVNDYQGFCMGPGTPVCPDAVISTASSSPLPQLADYRVDVSVTQITGADAVPNVALSDGLRITVTARHVPTATTVSLDGYRLRYAPNAP